MKVNEAAARLEISPTTCRRLVAAGKLGHYRIGLGRGVVRISPEHIDAYLNQHGHTAQPASSVTANIPAAKATPPTVSIRRPILRHL